MTTATTQPNTEQLTRIQIERAYKLAQAYHHTWGAFRPFFCYEQEEDVPNDPAYPEYETNATEGYRELMECKTVDEIRDLVHRRLEPGPAGWGVDAPGVDENGNLTHVTGTGRLSWTVHSEGTVFFTVTRPNCIAQLQAQVSDDELVCIDMYTNATEGFSIQQDSETGQIEVNENGTYVPFDAAKFSLAPFHRRHVAALADGCMAALGLNHYNVQEVEEFRRHPLIEAAMSIARPDGVIVSRHPAAVDFIRDEIPGSSAFPVLSEASEQDVRGQRVYGNIPLHLAALAESVTAVEFRGDPPRGAEYGEAEMRAAGARLRTYKVQCTGGGYGGY